MHTPKKLILGAAIAACFSSQPAWINPLWAAELNTNLPQSEEDVLLSQKITINLPAQPLAASLKALSAKIGLNITYNDKLVSDKQAPALSGTMRSKEALQKLLANTGLEAKLNDNTLYIQRVTKVEAKDIQLDKVEVRAKRFYEVGPLPGLGLSKEEIPGNVQSISAKEIKEAHALSITDLMNRKLQSVTVNDYQGNPFQMDVQYRGFTAGPQIGTPQGLSVFIDGIRVNEPFGDVVNWDLLPMNALASVDVFPGSNPIFGLNTLGGAFSLKTKDGFNNKGADVDILTGSFGRKQLQVEGGWNNGQIALFGAGNFFLEDGWRQNSPSRVNQAFGKASYRGDRLDLSLSTLLVKTELTGNGLLPNEMWAQDPTSIYTAPDKTDNTLAQFQLAGAFQATETFSITGQVYRRNSKRHQRGADVFRGIDDDLLARRIPSATEQYTCVFNSTNALGLPDYVVVDVAPGQSLSDPGGFLDTYFNTMTIDPTKSTLNGNLSPEFERYFKNHYEVFRNFYESQVYNRDLETLDEGDVETWSNGEPSYFSNIFDGQAFNVAFGPGSGDPLIASDENYFYTQDGVKHYVMLLSPTNVDNCMATQDLDKASDGPAFTYLVPGSTSTVATVNGAGSGTGGVVYEVDPDTGKKYYTPTSIFTDNQIDQIINGASVQLNWQFDHHKVMVGASIDASDSKYANRQQLGLLDAQRNAYLAPDDIHPMFAGADQWISNNDFSGTQNTKSIYFSENWSPVDDWHFSFSGRYNETQTKNKIAARRGIAAYEIGDVISYPDSYDICTDPATCTSIPTQYRLPRIANALDPAETEKFSYFSFNPQVGVSWQARPDLNVYANWAQGTRVPSAIELGCALDHGSTGVFYSDGQGGTYEVPKSVLENRQCTLPTTLSGDPYLPQIKATTYEVGVRGAVSESVQYNLTAYQTDLKDDIYFVAVGSGQGFFDTVGKTRRRGIEAGLKGSLDRFHFGLNYGLTDATFQDDFLMFSDDNSSGVYIPGLGNSVINVKPGDKMPGVSMHNLNATLSYDLTDSWNVGLTMVAHSDSFVRGNENNEHKVGVSRTFNSVRLIDDGAGNLIPDVFTRTLQPTTNPGKVPGYATFNLQTSYRISKEWTATMLVTNLFDKDYFTAGRLGRNPFSPSVAGNVGPDGYNHNSDDWRSTNFISPGAPRGVWFSLNWRFQPD